MIRKRSIIQSVKDIEAKSKIMYSIKQGIESLMPCFI